MDHATFKKEIWEAVRSMANELESLFSTFCDDRDITAAQSRILFMLSMEQQMTVSSLSRRLGIAPGNLSPLCKKLEQMGLLERQRSIVDERVVELSLTEQGRIRAQEIQNQIELRCSGAMAEITPEEMQNIVDGIRRMNELLIKIKTEAPEKV